MGLRHRLPHSTFISRRDFVRWCGLPLGTAMTTRVPAGLLGAFPGQEPSGGCAEPWGTQYRLTPHSVSEPLTWSVAHSHRANLWSLKNKPGCQRGPRMPLPPMTQSPAAPSSVCWRSCTHLGHRNPVPAGNATTPLRRLAHRISAYCDAHLPPLAVKRPTTSRTFSSNCGS